MDKNTEECNSQGEKLRCDVYINIYLKIYACKTASDLNLRP